MIIGEFDLLNDEKVNRARFGTVGQGGALKGGVGENASDAEVLAEYDRLGGGIMKDGAKVKNGSFYDFEKKKPRTTPDIVLLYRINGKDIEVPDGAELPLAVRAQKIAEAGEESTPARKSSKSRRKKDDDESDE